MPGEVIASYRQHTHRQESFLWTTVENEGGKQLSKYLVDALGQCPRR